MKLKVIVSVLLLVLVTGFCNAKGKKTLLVADRMVPCAGTYECLQIKYKANEQWHVFSDTIQGFNYQEGYQYKLLVQPLQTLNTLSGLYEEKYKLLRVVSKKKTGYNRVQALADKKWILTSMYDTKRVLTLYDTTITLFFSLKDNKIKGKNACNGYTGSFTAKDTIVSFKNISATKMLCKGQTIETIVFEFYDKIASFKLAGNILTLFQPNGAYLRFEGR